MSGHGHGVYYRDHGHGHGLKVTEFINASVRTAARVPCLPGQGAVYLPELVP